MFSESGLCENDPLPRKCLILPFMERLAALWPRLWNGRRILLWLKDVTRTNPLPRRSEDVLKRICDSFCSSSLTIACVPPNDKNFWKQDDVDILLEAVNHNSHFQLPGKLVSKKLKGRRAVLYGPETVIYLEFLDRLIDGPRVYYRSSNDCLCNLSTHVRVCRFWNNRVQIVNKTIKKKKFINRYVKALG